jgi:hypothetical protein
VVSEKQVVGSLSEYETILNHMDQYLGPKARLIPVQAAGLGKDAKRSTEG